MSESISSGDIGVVVIGRNEGERLRDCLTSLLHADRPIVYVDSGSTDGSMAMAAAMGADAISLSTAAAFTAARARNAGFQQLMAIAPHVRFVQFVDGDCTVNPTWLTAARATFDRMPSAAAVCGRRRERYPAASIYNRLCDLEWNTPIGEATECGGDAMMRVAAFTVVGGFNDTMIAGEEPELCVRLRLAGSTIHRIDAEMTLHDAAMTRFGQWWNRNVRAGHAFAEGSSLHGSSSLRHWVKQTRSNWIWGMIIPLVAIALAVPTRGISAAIWLAMLVALMSKIFLNGIRRGQTLPDAALVAPFCVIGKIPQAIGQARFVAGRWLGRRSGLIEYKVGSPGVSQIGAGEVEGIGAS